MYYVFMCIYAFFKTLFIMVPSKLLIHILYKFMSIKKELSKIEHTPQYIYLFLKLFTCSIIIIYSTHYKTYGIDTLKGQLS